MTNTPQQPRLADLVREITRPGASDARVFFRIAMTCSEELPAIHASLLALAGEWDEEAKKMAKQREYDIEGTLEDCASQLRALLGEAKS